MMIIHGDCVAEMQKMEPNSVDAIVTDPPYNLSFMSKPWDAYDGQEDSGFAYWLAGLIDGEGHFAIKAHTRGTYAPAFTLKMRADERGTLEMIRKKIGVGSINEEHREPNPMVKWVVQDKAGCQRLVDLLDKYPLRAKKLADYWSWREAVCEWTSRPRGNRWVGASDNSKMAALRERLMSGRAYSDIPWSGNEFQDWCRVWSTECLRVLKPGGHLLAFGGTRTWHRLAVAVEDAGFEMRDSIAWLYGAGFPKSLDVSKAIDKASGAEREVVGPGPYANRGRRTDNAVYGESTPSDAEVTTAPATDAVKQWDGWGTALKPAFEPVVVARKPLVGTVAANVQEYGTGALNIDRCRIGTERRINPAAGNKPGGASLNMSAVGMPRGVEDREATGRWPANVILDEHTAAELDKQSGASRFFYCAKAPKKERPTVDGVSHPTVKPVSLMRWLVRLVTPPGGVVLDPFLGSGTTAEACEREGFEWIGIEREADYVALSKARLTKMQEEAV